VRTRRTTDASRSGSVDRLPATPPGWRFVPVVRRMLHDCHHLRGHEAGGPHRHTSPRHLGHLDRPRTFDTSTRRPARLASISNRCTPEPTSTRTSTRSPFTSPRLSTRSKIGPVRTDASSSPGHLGLRSTCVRGGPGHNGARSPPPRRPCCAPRGGRGPSDGGRDATALVASGLPDLRRGSRCPLHLEGLCVAYWWCTGNGVQPLVAHAGWRISRRRQSKWCCRPRPQWPAPRYRSKRRVAREARGFAEGNDPPASSVRIAAGPHVFERAHSKCTRWGQALTVYAGRPT
jgi:hypothetical protein